MYDQLMVVPDPNSSATSVFPVQPHEATEMVAEAEIYLQNGT